MPTPRRNPASTEPVSCPVCGKGHIKSFKPDPGSAAVRITHTDGQVCSQPVKAERPAAR